MQAKDRHCRSSQTRIHQDDLGSAQLAGWMDSELCVLACNVPMVLESSCRTGGVDMYTASSVAIHMCSIVSWPLLMMCSLDLMVQHASATRNSLHAVGPRFGGVPSAELMGSWRH
jgi:hypothetical protein